VPTGVFTILCVNTEFHLHTYVFIRALLFTLAVLEHEILKQKLAFPHNFPAFTAYTLVTLTNIEIRKFIVTRGSINGLFPFDCGRISQRKALTYKVLYQFSIRFYIFESLF
jgi:hypothetical protein